jgi:hypothetical protein
MTTAITTHEHGDGFQSPFAAADVCELAGLTLPEDTYRPVFDDDLWNLTEVVGLPVQLALASRCQLEVAPL